MNHESHEYEKREGSTVFFSSYSCHSWSVVTYSFHATRWSTYTNSFNPEKHLAEIRIVLISGCRPHRRPYIAGSVVRENSRPPVRQPLCSRANAMRYARFTPSCQPAAPARRAPGRPDVRRSCEPTRARADYSGAKRLWCDRRAGPGSQGLQSIRGVEQRHHRHQLTAFDREVDAAAMLVLVERSRPEHRLVQQATVGQDGVADHFGLEEALAALRQRSLLSESTWATPRRQPCLACIPCYS